MGNTNGSANVSTREIDISGPSTRTSTGTPPCVISATTQGPAFVPVATTTLSEYASVFGGVNANTPLGYLSAREWFANSSVPLVQIRVLGAGQGLTRNANGTVSGSGFVVGSQQPMENAAGALGNNTFANSGGVTGSVYMLGCFMSESVSSKLFSDAGLQTGTGSVPIIRGVIFAPSGVVLRLSSAAAPSAAPGAGFIGSENSFSGSFTGSLNIQGGSQKFVMILNGHKGTDSRYPSVLSASFDPTAVDYFPSIFNTDPLKAEQAGHLLYSHFDIYSSFAAPTGSGVIVPNSGSVYGVGIENIAFLVPGSGSAATHTSNLGSAVTPNFENFEDRYGNAFSPWVISQGFGGTPYSLFRFHHLSDGDAGNSSVKISIVNIQPGTATQPYGTFDVQVRSIYDRDEIGASKIFEQYTKCSLDPTAANYIGKKIGTIHSFFNFDTDVSSQKIVTVGEYPVQSRYVRVEIADIVENMDIDPSAIPFGFRGPQHLVTAGSRSLYNIRQGDLLAGVGSAYFNTSSVGEYPLYKAVQPPIPMRLNLKKAENSNGVDSSLFWGVHFQNETSTSDPNGSSIFNESILNFAKFYPSFSGTNAQFAVYGNNGTAPTTASYILDSDQFNNNLFSLEKVKIVTGSSNKPNTSTSALINWSYVRNGVIAADGATKTRALMPSDLVNNAPAQSLAKFSFYLERGFDGVRSFNSDTKYLKNSAVAQEIAMTNRGLVTGATVQSYIKALSIVSDVNELSMQLLTIPGIRERYITDSAINAVEQDRFDCFYIMDIEQFGPLGASQPLTGSYTNVSIAQTAADFSARGVNSSFAAAYFPDVNIRLDNGVVYDKMPPSVVVLGAYGNNDAIGQVFNAPAGYGRGTLRNVTDFAAVIDKPNADTLYVVNINPLLSKTGVGPVVWGQKTTLAKESLLNRVNVRRLLIAIRREVRKVGNQFLFEPAREETLKSFNAAVQPIMQRYQAAGGVSKYKVAIDTSTTSQADLDNKTIRGKVFLIPTTSLEFLSIDFIVSNRNNSVGG